MFPSIRIPLRNIFYDLNMQFIYMKTRVLLRYISERAIGCLILYYLRKVTRTFLDNDALNLDLYTA